MGKADRGPAIFRGATLRAILCDTTAMWGLDFVVRKGVIIIGTPNEVAERVLGVRSFGHAGAERWSRAVELEGPARLLGLRVDASKIAVYTRSNDGAELHVHLRADGQCFVRMALE